MTNVTTMTNLASFADFADFGAVDIMGYNGLWSGYERTHWSTTNMPLTSKE